MFPTLTQQNTIEAFLICSIAVALILLVATRGRLGYRRNLEAQIPQEPGLPG
jgi:uncharacterized protein